MFQTFDQFSLHQDSKNINVCSKVSKKALLFETKYDLKAIKKTMAHLRTKPLEEIFTAKSVL